MKKIFPALLSVLLLAVLTLHGQELEITGKIISAADGGPLPGVMVQLKGTSLGTRSDSGGLYNIKAARGSVLTFLLLGFTGKEVVVGQEKVIDIALKEDKETLSEVVVIGYGTRLREDLTGSIARITAGELEDIPLQSFETALQGRASGVFMNSGSGKLGQGISIRIRGYSSISASNQPLFVIDGIPVISRALETLTGEADNPLATINPHDIISIEVLKDASAAAIYGSRAAGGVILVTTRQGKAGKTRVNVSLRTGISNPTHEREFLDAGQYRELLSESINNASWLGGASPQEVWEMAAGTDDWTSDYNSDWAGASFRQGNLNEANISLSGGNEKTMFYLSSGYNDQKGILNANRFNRANVLANLAHAINDKIKLGLKLSLSKSTNYRVPDDNAFANPMQLNAIPPIQPVRDPETGEYNPFTYYDNNLRNIAGSNTVGKQFRSLNGLDLSYELLPGLTWRSDFSLDFVQLEEDLYRSENTTEGAPTGYGYNSQTRVSNFNTDHTLTYSRDFNERHKLEALGGFSYQEVSSFRTSTEGKGFPNAQFKRIASASVITGGLTEESGYNFVSWFARANYKFDDRYLLGASARVDGSSRFGEDNRFGIFPSVSAGWIVTRENFLQRAGALSFLKLRASYGVTGNSEIDNFASRSLWSALPYADQAGIIFDQIGVRSLSWEKNKQFDAGIDFGLLNNRITGEVDYFIKRSNGLLLDFQLPGTSGFTVITKNVGAMENRGWELALTSNNLVKDFKWSTTFNISTYRNRVLDMNGTVINPESTTMGKVAEGKPFGFFYGMKYAGVNPANGNARYFEEDGTLSDQDEHSGYEQMVGNPHPDFYGGVGNSFSYKGFDLDILAQFVYGNDIYNMAGIYQSVNGNGMDNQTSDQMDYWREPGDVTDIPQPRFGESNGARKSSRWVEDGSYLRIKNVALGYNIPSGFLERYKIGSVRIYLSAQNLFTLTGYSGYDPEVNSYAVNDTNLGHDFYTPPQLRTIAFGINIGL